MLDFFLTVVGVIVRAGQSIGRCWWFGAMCVSTSWVCVANDSRMDEFVVSTVLSEVGWTERIHLLLSQHFQYTYVQPANSCLVGKYIGVGAGIKWGRGCCQIVVSFKRIRLGKVLVGQGGAVFKGSGEERSSLDKVVLSRDFGCCTAPHKYRVV